MDRSALSTIKEEAAETQVLVFAGGMGTRMGTSTPKALLVLNGKTLIERCIRLFSSCGFRDFVFLLGHGHAEVQEKIGNGKKYGINASVSVDPRVGFGRGRSLLHAVRGGRIDRKRRSVITFPDDVFTDSLMPVKVLSEHLYGASSLGIIASLVLTKGRYWPYGVADVDERNMITGFAEKPFIQRPTSVGNYIFEPAVFPILESVIDMEGEGRSELEVTLIPELARQRKLYGIFIPPDSWLPINTVKDFAEAERALGQK